MHTCRISHLLNLTQGAWHKTLLVPKASSHNHHPICLQPRNYPSRIYQAQPPTSGMVTLCSLVFGDTQPFVVEICRDKLVAHLKKAIVAEEPNKFLGISTSGLILSKVEVPDDEKAIQAFD